MVDSEISDQMKSNVRSICRDYLGGIWDVVRENDIKIIRITGGLSNKMYKCSLSENISPLKDEPQQVIVRMYGQIIQENCEIVVTDSVLYAICAEQKIGPKLLGVFSGGRVEEYLEANHLEAKQLRDYGIYSECARIMAHIHKLTMPLIKKPIWLFNNLSLYLEQSLAATDSLHCNNDEKQRLQKILSKDISKEYQCLKNLLKEIDSPVVFCHNDMQEGNILMQYSSHEKGRSWRLIPIDFEYASYNFRGFDIANFFCEWCYDYRNNNSYPYYSVNLNHYPSKSEQKKFINTYVAEFAERDIDYTLDECLEIDMLQEIAAFSLASHLFWALWSLLQAHKSTIKFGYLNYALDRFDAYFIQKEEYFKTYR